MVWCMKTIYCQKNSTTIAEYEDKISVYMEKVKVSFTTVNLAEEH